MTKKDYELIAATLRGDAAHLNLNESFTYGALNMWHKGAYDQWHTIALAMATALASDNPRFDRARFLTACGVQS